MTHTQHILKREIALLEKERARIIDSVMYGTVMSSEICKAIMKIEGMKDELNKNIHELEIKN